MAEPKSPAHSLRRLSESFSGVLAVAARAEDTGEFVALDPDRVMPTASVIKLAVLAEVLRQDQAGSLSLGEQIVLDESNRVGGSGVLKDLSPGVALSVLDYATLMIVMSDNTATNMLIDRVGGVGAVNRFVGEQLGLETIALHRKVSFTALEPGSSRPFLGEASPRHLMELISLIWQRKLVSPQACDEMLAILGRQHFLDQVPRFLDCGLLAEEGTPPKASRWPARPAWSTVPAPMPACCCCAAGPSATRSCRPDAPTPRCTLTMKASSRTRRLAGSWPSISGRGPATPPFGPAPPHNPDHTGKETQ